MRRTWIGLAVTLALAVGCNRAPGSAAGDTGSASFALRVPGVQLDVIHWSIGRGTPPTVVKQGDHLVPQTGPSAAFLVTGLVGGPHVIDLSGSAAPSPVQPDQVDCRGSATATVVPGMTTHTTVLLVCTQTPSQGGVTVGTQVQFEDCPYLTSYLLSSTQPGVGGTVDVSAAAADRDPSLPLAFRWSASARDGAPAGTFDDASSATTRFHCPAGFRGEQLVAVRVTNGVSREPESCPLAGQSISILCVPTHCGDGVVQAGLGEECDNGRGSTGNRLNGPGTGCTYDCRVFNALCGDGIIDASETCDDGNTVDCDGCSPSCTIEVGGTCASACTACRESRRGASPPGGCQAQMGCETIGDPGDRVLCQNLRSCLYAHPACWATDPRDCFCGPEAPGVLCFDQPQGPCLAESLAAAKVSPGQFSLASTRYYDPAYPSGHATQEIVCNRQCGAVCGVAVCGDGVIQGSEACDDGNTTNCGGCTSTCQYRIPECGDGCVGPGEQCDDGNNNSCDGCSALCAIDVVPVCGNGVVECNETCDDGNTSNGDTCSSQCQGMGFCGDGFLSPATGETCDDGNVISGDGCNALCRIEPNPPASCLDCRESRRGVSGSAGCNLNMGCETLATPADRQLCETLRDCMYAHPTCWASRPIDCYCGTATGIDCTMTPNGVCRDQAVAAAKTTSPTDYSATAIRFFNTMFPAGRAAQQVACDLKCAADGFMCP